MLEVVGKTSDMCTVMLGEREHEGYVPHGLGIRGVGGEDYIDFALCLDCGKVQGKFPISAAAVQAVFGGE